MRIIILLIGFIALSACTTFQNNEASLRRACKSGVNQYDDGTTSFSCFVKEKK